MKQPSAKLLTPLLPLLLGACDPAGGLDRPLFPEVADQQQASQESRRQVKEVIDTRLACPTSEEAKQFLDSAIEWAADNHAVPSHTMLTAGMRTFDAFRDDVRRVIVNENGHPSPGDYTYFYIDPARQQFAYDSSTIGGVCVYNDMPQRNLESDARRAMALAKEQKGRRGKKGRR